MTYECSTILATPNLEFSIQRWSAQRGLLLKMTQTDEVSFQIEFSTPADELRYGEELAQHLNDHEYVQWRQLRALRGVIDSVRRRNVTSSSLYTSYLQEGQLLVSWEIHKREYKEIMIEVLSRYWRPTWFVHV